METILFDTDYLIDFLRGKPSVREPIIKALSDEIAFISILSIYELYSGMRPHEEEATNNCIEAFHIEPVTIDICKKAGAMRFKCMKEGITLSIVDCIIAETARKNKHLVATNNRKHYPHTNFYM